MIRFPDTQCSERRHHNIGHFKTGASVAGAGFYIGGIHDVTPVTSKAATHIFWTPAAPSFRLDHSINFSLPRSDFCDKVKEKSLTTGSS